ncbi:hypothetical protein AGABI2DRAFT_143775 [Agaricus bisporus var. bisporus H97]|uniref:hypothetical protein n=1 Tax=Agaricus bisporus var. bisporus (strain H97 / ATCC MYA-4626 / FGSC 10389) TaxID=936046 RepID=UPI00029F6825|nr:hypothetical protein AGABI2DRAFT_143775 [Agaricus bisporus var. bisporus H97]EKV46762.1 hypothetical protein AGABI2DRAFT_143775 [Agaricus bisporus var. bisporus H97]
MSDANAIEEDYVETSDAEELEVLYPVVVEELLSSSPIITPKRGPQEDGSDRKRRKLSHTTYEEFVSPSREPPLFIPSQTKDVDAIQVSAANEVKIEVHNQPSPRSLHQLGASQRVSLPEATDGDSLPHFARPISPQLFTPKASFTRESPRFVAADDSQKLSQDELDLIRPEFSLRLPAPLEPVGTSEISSNKDDITSTFLSPSPLSSLDGMHSQDENIVSPGSSQRNASSPNSTTVDLANVEDEALTRYPLRRRQPNQLHPYRFDEYVYKRGLKDNPAAFIDVLRLRRRRGNQPEDHYEEDDYVQEESQEQVAQSEVQREHIRSPLMPALLGLVDPLSDSESGSDDLAEEARRIDRDMRRRRKEEEARQKEAREEERREREKLKAARKAQRKPKSFPALDVPVRQNGPVPQNHEVQIVNTARRTQSLAPLSPRSSSPTPTTPAEDVNEGEETHERKKPNELQALRDYFMDDFAMASEEVDSRTAVSEPPPSTKTVELEDNSSPSPVQDSDGSLSSDSDQGDLSSADDKKYRELFKLYPPGMARALLKGDKLQSRRRHDAESPVEEGPLLPGQSRARRAANPKDIRDIRGDSDSDESDVEKRSTFSAPSSSGNNHDYMDYDMNNTLESQAQEVGRVRTQGYPQSIAPSSFSAPEIIEISDDESSSHSSEEEVMDEDDLNTLLGDDDAGIVYDAGPGHNAVKEESMIDWMLSRTRIVGSTISKPRTVKRRRHPSKKGTNRVGGARSLQSNSKSHVAARSARRPGKERQTLLSFANHTSAGNSGSSSNHAQVRLAPNAIVVEIQGAERKSWKERHKERRERAKRQGVYSMANSHTAAITSGKSKKLMKVTIDLDDDDEFYRSFASPNQPLEAGFNAKGKSRASISHKSSDDLADQRVSSQTTGKSRPRLKRQGEPVHQCTVDMDVKPLQPGITFHSESFLREGHLHALVNTLTPDSSPCRPDPTYLCHININSSMDSTVFLQELERIFDGLLAFVSEIPSDGYEEKVKDWNVLMRSACRHISWFYHQNFGESRDRITSFIKERVFSAISKLREIPSSSLNNTVLSLCWLCIEASVRSGHRYGSSNLSEVCPTHASVSLLVHHLVGYGLRRPYEVVKKNQVLCDAETPCYAAQMWICLLHLLLACDQQLSDGISKGTSFWEEILHYYQKFPPTNAFDFAESLWEIIFTSMALSQFSLLGVVASEPHLSPSWAVVARAVKQVQLAQGNKIGDISPSILQQRDSYFYIVISRCYHLLDRWGWKMDHSFGTLTQLIDVFRARNFVNLHGEKADYPDFMLDGDWKLLSQFHPATDSGFTLILKLLMRAIESKCLSEAEIRKMVSLIIPVSKFKTEEKIPGVDDLSPICNRFAAVALVIGVDSTYATRMIRLVRSSINFEASDPTTQLLSIRGIKLLISLLIHRNVRLQEVIGWFDAIINNVAVQFKTLRAPGPVIQTKQGHDVKARNHSLLVMLLYATGRAAMETFTARAQYPDTAILLAFKPFLEPECRKLIEEASCSMVEMRRFIESFLNARCKLLPLPPEPIIPTTHVDDPESQDYDFGIDFGDPATLALLGDQENDFASIKETEVGVNLVHDHGALPNWDFCLKEISQLWPRIRIGWLKTRVKLAVWFEVLRHDPSYYSSKKSDYLELLFESLAIHDMTVEPTFWRRIVLHEYNSNAFFKDTATTLSSFENGDIIDGKGFRNALLQVLFANVESSLQNNTPDSSVQIELCLKFLSSTEPNTMPGVNTS